jgi:hypothetical protein
MGAQLGAKPQGAISLGGVDLHPQKICLWFVMIRPNCVLLLLALFKILHCNPLPIHLPWDLVFLKLSSQEDWLDYIFTCQEY